MSLAAKLNITKTSIAAADLLNDRAPPLCEEQGMAVLLILRIRNYT